MRSQVKGPDTRSASMLGTTGPSIMYELVWANSLLRSPDTAKVKDKMLYASSKDALRKKLVGIATGKTISSCISFNTTLIPFFYLSEIQATDFSEVAYESVLEKVSRSTN
jgi:hypothetical protein